MEGWAANGVPVVAGVRVGQVRRAGASAAEAKKGERVASAHRGMERLRKASGWRLPPEEWNITRGFEVPRGADSPRSPGPRPPGRAAGSPRTPTRRPARR